MAEFKSIEIEGIQRVKFHLLLTEKKRIPLKRTTGSQVHNCPLIQTRSRLFQSRARIKAIIKSVDHVLKIDTGK